MLFESIGDSFGLRRDAEDFSAALERAAWLLVRLWLYGIVDKSTFQKKFARSSSTWTRDVNALASLGHVTGLTLANKRGVVRVEHRIEPVGVPTTSLARILQALAEALGPPVAHAVSPLVGRKVVDSPFYHLAMPRFAANHEIAELYAALEASFEAHAAVEFTYTTNHGDVSERRVEPNCVIQHGGRYYLVGYCHGRRDWRFFALDAISSSVRRVATVQKPRTPDFDLDASVGFIRGSEPPTEVTVHIAPSLAATVRSQRWQAQQRIIGAPDGGLYLTVVITDFEEIARWTMSFGAGATIVAPPAAVSVVRELLEASLAKHASVPARKSSRIA